MLRNLYYKSLFGNYTCGITLDWKSYKIEVTVYIAKHCSSGGNRTLKKVAFETTASANCATKPWSRIRNQINVHKFGRTYLSKSYPAFILEPSVGIGPTSEDYKSTIITFILRGRLSNLHYHSFSCRINFYGFQYVKELHAE